MKLKELKSSVVIAMAVPYIKCHGTKCMDTHHPRIDVWVDSLDMMLSTAYPEKPYQRLDIWDHRIGKKVYSADISPLEIIRCDTGEWFNLFLQCIALQAGMAIEKYLETRTDPAELSLKPEEMAQMASAGRYRPDSVTADVEA